MASDPGGSVGVLDTSPALVPGLEVLEGQEAQTNERRPFKESLISKALTVLDKKLGDASANYQTLCAMYDDLYKQKQDLVKKVDEVTQESERTCFLQQIDQIQVEIDSLQTAMDVKEQSIEKLKSAIKGEERKCYKMQKLNPLKIKKVPTQPLKDKQVGVMIKKLSDKMCPVTLPAQTGEAAAECKPESSPGCNKPAALSIAIPECLNEITVHKLRSRSIKRVVETLIEKESDLQKPLGVSIARDATQCRDSTAEQNLEESPDRHLQSGTGSSNPEGQKHGPDTGTKMGTGTSKQSSTQDQNLIFQTEYSLVANS
ncbi:Hypothetical predicted protein [Pelobates cultripes]|uniref:Uncharacterized protein n=1 Tax=Pelobates cultripes TaxID=61616 RepID=A0AAD1T2I8_PELCU|nr:Hypothetical predicted protein [Pelobates cultripes]CAH2302256.1 Hypothetical predicted protein [Pelobates cultripes]CAH2313915.1 Hypothetical predicted protein [Pelobates cultripes]